MEDKKALMEPNLRDEFMPIEECTEMEVDENENGSTNNEEGDASGSNVVFSREGPLVSDEHPGMFVSSCTCGAAKKLKSGLRTSSAELGNTENTVIEKKLSRQEVLKAEAGAKVQKFTEWALKCIGFHSRGQGNGDGINQNSPIQIQLQLSAFKTFHDLAGNHLSGKDFTEAFYAACFPLTLFSTSFDPGSSRLLITWFRLLRVLDPVLAHLHQSGLSMCVAAPTAVSLLLFADC